LYSLFYAKHTKPECVHADGAQAISIVDNIHKLKGHLRDIIDPDFGLLDHLISLDILTLENVKEIKFEKTAWKRNDKLLEFFAGKTVNECQQFLAVLETLSQCHVVEFIRQNGGQ
jgi:hypothetical protein